ncbi:hypothetical protein [Nocardia sp. NPDC057353]|uniref:hypothetical protein n=1 Tax=Nocardia sp. NPDC057353 TaxID=3346104 RepID=UPI00363162A2
MSMNTDPVPRARRRDAGIVIDYDGRILLAESEDDARRPRLSRVTAEPFCGTDGG